MFDPFAVVEADQARLNCRTIVSKAQDMLGKGSDRDRIAEEVGDFGNCVSRAKGLIDRHRLAIWTGGEGAATG